MKFIIILFGWRISVENDVGSVSRNIFQDKSICFDSNYHFKVVNEYSSISSVSTKVIGK